MSITATRESVLDTSLVKALPGTLIDELAEAVAWPPNPHARAQVICRITEEIVETLQWLHGVDSNHVELSSLRRFAEQARAHRDRMRANQPGLSCSDFQPATRFYAGCTLSDQRGSGRDDRSLLDRQVAEKLASLPTRPERHR